MQELPPEARAYFAAANARRTRSERVCAECGAAFVGLAVQLYCTKSCRDRASQRAARARRKSSSIPPTN